MRTCLRRATTKGGSEWGDSFNFLSNLTIWAFYPFFPDCIMNTESKLNQIKDGWKHDYTARSDRKMKTFLYHSRRHSYKPGLYKAWLGESQVSINKSGYLLFNRWKSALISLCCISLYQTLNICFLFNPPRPSTPCTDTLTPWDTFQGETKKPWWIIDQND